jgi:hypothetical protein
MAAARRRLEISALDDGLGERTVVPRHFLAFRRVRIAEFGFAPIDQ